MSGSNSNPLSWQGSSWQGPAGSPSSDTGLQTWLAQRRQAQSQSQSFDPAAMQWQMNQQQAGGFNPQSLYNPLTPGGLYASGYTNPGAGLADLIAQQQGMQNTPMQAQAGAGRQWQGPQQPQQPAQGGQQWQSPVGPNDVMAAAYGLPTQQQAMQQWDPRQYGQPGNTPMWNQVQGLLGNPGMGPQGPNLGNAGRG